MATPRLFVFSFLAVMLGMASVLTPTNASGNYDEPLGMFALIDDASVRESMSLSPATLQKLATFLDERDQAATELMKSLESATLAEKQAKIAAFSAESEKQGAALISVDQLKVLRHWDLASRGMESLADPFVVEQLGLNADQQSEIASLLSKRSKELTNASGLQANLIRNRYEVDLAKVLNSAQFAGWRILTDDVPTISSTETEIAEAGDETASEANSIAATPAVLRNGAATSEANSEAPVESVAANETAQEDVEVEQDEVADPTEAVEEVAAADDSSEETATEEVPTEESSSMEEEAVKPAKTPVQEERIIRFSFDKTEWGPVLEWFAEQADFSLQMDLAPDGTFSYQDDAGAYTVSEALDQINHVLLTRGYTLVRNGRMLMLVDLKDGIPRAVIETVRPEDLNQRGKYEVMRCIYDLKYISDDEVEDQIEPLIEEDGEYGNFFSVTSANRLVVQSTGDKLRLVRDLLEAAREKYDAETNTIGVHVLKYVTPEEIMSVARPLLDIDPDDLGNDDIRIAIEDFGTRIFFQGNPETVKLFKEIIDQVDVPGQNTDIAADVPTLKIYELMVDPETVHQVLQYLLAGAPDIRMQINPSNGNLIVNAHAAEHEFIERTINQMQQRTTDISIIQLRAQEPVSVISLVTSILKLDEEGVKGPSIDADPIRNQIIVRGTPQQIAEVRSIVEGIDPPIGTTDAGQERTRVIETGSIEEAQEMARYIETMWNTQSQGNRLDIVWPKDMREGLDIRGAKPTTTEEQPEATPSTPPPFGSNQELRRNLDRMNVQPVHTTGVGRRSDREFQFVSYPTVAQDELPSRFRNEGRATTPSAASGDTPPIKVTVTPYGIILESDDVGALNSIEDMIYTRSFSDLPVKPKIVLLKHSKAAEAHSLLSSILGLSSDSGGGGGLPGLIPGMANQMMPGMGDMLDAFGGGGGSSSTGAGLELTGSVSIVPDPSKNALWVQANSIDYAVIEEMIDFIDQPGPPQSPETLGQSYVIQVNYRSAEELVTIIKAQMAENIRSQQSGNNGGGGDPRQLQQQIIQQMLRGGRGGRGGGGGGNNNVEVEPPKMSISADAASNMILVTGPEFLYHQVDKFVKELDKAEVVDQQTISVIELNSNVSAAVLEESLKNLFGDNIQTGSSTSGTSRFGGTTTNRGFGGTTGGGNNAAQQMMMQRMMQRGGGGGFTGGGGRGGGGGGRGGGGGGRGGR